MSKYFRTFPRITVSMLFDGRLEPFNVREGEPDGNRTELDWKLDPLSPAYLEAYRRWAMADDMSYDWQTLNLEPSWRWSLTDGSNVVHVCSSYAVYTEYVGNLILVGPDVSDILNAIEKACDCRIVSEDDPRGLGCDTWEEFFQRGQVPETHEQRDEFFAELRNFLHGKPHRFKPRTRGMEMAERARLKIEAKPELIEPENQAALLGLIF